MRNRRVPDELTNSAELLPRLVHQLQVHQLELEMQNEELRSSRAETERLLERYTDLYDFAPIGYVTLGLNGNIRAVNLIGAELLGNECSDLIGCRFGQFVAAEDSSCFTAFLEKCFASQTKEACELRLLIDTQRPLYVQIEALTSNLGQECRMAIVDITARKQLEKKLDKLRSDLSARAAELEAANIDLEAYNSTVSHDLRQPLVIISCYAQFLQELCDNQTNKRFKEYLREIEESAMLMGRRIDFLLSFSSVGHKNLCWEQVDLSAMARELATGLKLTAPWRHVTFRITKGIRITTDPELCRLLLENLIGNAWKFTGEQEEAVIEFGATQIDGKLVCFVKDNGPGFAKADAKKVFSPFQRLPGSIAKGYGIGLATVQRIIQRHGGSVWAESALGMGATFFFQLG
ncbi:MAG: PAS domain S-box protein [Desulfuromonadaceae bacterium]|nr:PAS domain S-box protein [Desulfuromonadaceae bacterium]